MSQEQSGEADALLRRRIVHNVYKGDHEGFLAAIKESMETEVPR